MIRLTMTKREFIYWLGGLTSVPVVLFVAGVAFGAAIYINPPQPGIASSQGPAEMAHASMLAAVEISDTNDAIEKNKNRLTDLDQSLNAGADIKQFESPASENVAESATNSPSTAVESTATRGMYSVQIGNFSNEKNAVSLARNLRAKGYSVKTLLVNNTKALRHYYKVRLGHYQSHTEAAAAAADYRAREHATAFVTNDRGNGVNVNYL